MAFDPVILPVLKASLSVVQEDLENFHLENASLAQDLKETSNVGLMVVSKSFENDLLQVDILTLL